MEKREQELLSGLKTESRNPRTMELDQMSIRELLEVMNEEDQMIAAAVKKVLPEIEKAVKAVVKSIGNGGRLIYAGAGTSGRLGILDAVECIPTFSTTNEVLGILAGGEKAFVRAQEGVEDSEEEAQRDLEKLGLTDRDVVAAVTASGRTPYCVGALKYAKSVGACCVAISCNSPAKLSGYGDIAIEADAGPEILTGSTRLKAGTAQKMILNMISTASMVGIGKVYGNLMVDMKATNLKLEERAKRIVTMACDCQEAEAVQALRKANGSIKTAIVMILTGVEKDEAEEKLKAHGGFVRRCL